MNKYSKLDESTSKGGKINESGNISGNMSGISGVK